MVSVLVRVVSSCPSCLLFVPFVFKTAAASGCPAISQRTSTTDEKSLPPLPRLRAVLKASRATAAIGTGTFAALAASTMSVRSLWARSMVKPGVMSPLSTFAGHAILSWPLVAVVPWMTSSVFSSWRPKRCDSAIASALSWHEMIAR